MKNKIILATALLATIIAVVPILAIIPVQAKKHHNNDTVVTPSTPQPSSIVGNYGQGYNAGKAAAIAHQSDICTGTGTAFCTGFHVGYAWASFASNSLK